MNKLFATLCKPAKWILVIGSFVYAAWFAIQNAGSMAGTFMSVVIHLIILVVGTVLLVAVPVLVLFKKDEMAKGVFLILVGYWLLTTIQALFGYAEGLTEFNDGLYVTSGVFAFITGLGLTAVLVLIVLELALKKPGLRLFTFLVMLGVIVFSFVTSILLFISSIQTNAPWYSCGDVFVENLLLPALVCFGALYFLGAPKGKGE